MWTLRRILALGLAVFAGFLFLGFVGSSHLAYNFETSTTPHGGCPLDARAPVGRFSPEVNCPPAIPNGGSWDPCGFITAGLKHCTETLPDFNPSDWLAWAGNAIACDASVIWGAIVGDVSAFFVAVVNGVTAAINSVIQTVLGLIVGVIQQFEGLINGVVNSVLSVGESWAANTGPFAPVVTVAFVLAIMVAASFLLYLMVIAFIAGAKSIFNLL